MLFAMVAHAKGASKRIACVANAKSHSGALGLYVNDYDQTIPPLIYSKNTPDGYVYVDSYPKSQSVVTMFDLLEGYSKAGMSIYQCQDGKDSIPLGDIFKSAGIKANPSIENVDYFVNLALIRASAITLNPMNGTAGSTQLGQAWVTFESDIPKPSDTVVTYDATYIDQGEVNPEVPDSFEDDPLIGDYYTPAGKIGIGNFPGTGLNHSSRTTVSFLDGHAGSIASGAKLGLTAPSPDDPSGAMVQVYYPPFSWDAIPDLVAGP